MIASNLGQILGRLMYGFEPPKHEATAGLGNVQRAILETLAGERLPISAKLLSTRTGLGMIDICCALPKLVKRGLAVRTGTRGKYLYARPGLKV